MKHIEYTTEQNQSLITATALLFKQNDLTTASEALGGLTSQRDIRDAAGAIREAVDNEETARLAAVRNASSPTKSTAKKQAQPPKA